MAPLPFQHGVRCYPINGPFWPLALHRPLLQRFALSVCPVSLWFAAVCLWRLLALDFLYLAPHSRLIMSLRIPSVALFSAFILFRPRISYASGLARWTWQLPYGFHSVS